MADEDEIDILGDFRLSDFSTSDTSLLGNTPLVSQNSDILNCDYTIHPQWLLDRPSTNPDNWYESHAGTSVSETLESDTFGPVSTENCITDESGWIEKEKNLLNRGIEIFGKNSMRLSQFVGTKTASEVKYYLKNYLFENPSFYQSAAHSKIEELPSPEIITASEILDPEQIPASIEEVIAVVSTGSPTVSSSPKQEIKTNLGRSIFLSKNTSKLHLHKSQKTQGIETKMQLLKKAKSFKEQEILGRKKIKFKSSFKKIDLSKRGRSKKEFKKTCKNFQSKIDPKIVEITTGKGLAVPVCEGEEIVKIQKVDDDSSDVDIEDTDDVAASPIKQRENNFSQVFNEVSKNEQTLHCENQSSTSENPEENMEKFAEYCDLTQFSPEIVEKLTCMEEPSCEVKLNEQQVTELEKVVHSDFFEGRAAKTPERYLKIRNHILSRWSASKPNYVKKTLMRVGLKNCGDVSCISRIHYFLEQIAAINFGCEQTKYERPLSNVFPFTSSSVEKSNKKHNKLVPRKTTDLGPRQRIKKKFVNDGEGGCTLIHGDQGQVINTTIVNEEPLKPRSFIKKSSIRLIYCRPFTEDKPQEFTVRICLSTLLQMDFHAHTYLTEVMGLVGGCWDARNKILTVSCYEPCKNIASSSTHCDMCPVSQARAVENMHSRNFDVLGWFHSHPTFAPEPSQQDLDTQNFLQQWIGLSRPCIGVILSPFSSNGALISSPYRCLMVDKKPNFEDQLVPYKFKVDVIEDDFTVTSFLEDVQKILFSDEDYLKDKKISFGKPYFRDVNITHLEKFLSSVNLHFARSSLNKTTCDGVVQGIRDLLLKI